jgi:hypothetical protein
MLEDRVLGIQEILGRLNVHINIDPILGWAVA